MASTLTTLIPEIFDSILDILDLEASCSLRLACRVLYDRTLIHFGRSYFESCQTDLSLSSLRRLLQISQTNYLRHHVRQIVVQCRAVSKFASIKSLGQSIQWQRNFTSTGWKSPLPDAWMLRTIFAGGFPNCRSFCIYGLSFDGPSRYLDANDGVAAVLSIITENKIPVKTLNIDFAYGPDYCYISQFVPAKIQMSPHQMARFTTIWPSLEWLSIRVSLLSECGVLPDLILQALNLRALTLNFDYKYTASFLNSLLPSAHRLQRLKALYLSRFHADTDLVLKLLQSFSTELCELGFSSIRLDAGSTWIDILRYLQEHFPHLQSVSIRSLSQEEPMSYVRDMIFPSLSDYKIIPGFDFKDPDGTGVDCRLVKATSTPMRLHHAESIWGTQVDGVHYMGADTSTVLEELINAAAFV